MSSVNSQFFASLQSFKRSLLLFIHPSASPIYTIQHARGLKLLTRLRLGLSHLREHKFRHNFNDTINPLCSCGTNSIESVERFLLHCPNFSIYRCSLGDNLRQKDICILPYSSSYLVKILLFGNDKFKIITNKKILTSVIDFIIQFLYVAVLLGGTLVDITKVPCESATC